MKGPVISAITLAFQAAILIADVGRAFPVPFATKDGNIDGVKVATRHDESFVDPQTIQVREEQGFPSLPIVLRSIDVPSIAEIQARSADHRVVLPDLPPPFVLLRNAIRNGTERALQVHQYDLEPEVSTFRLPPPPFLDRYREKLEEHLKGHLFTLLREARQSTHSRIRIMQLWVLITAYDLIQLGWQPYGYPFHGLFVARKYALEGVVQSTSGQYSPDEQGVAEDCLRYYDEVRKAYNQPEWPVLDFHLYLTYASDMFNILSSFSGNHWRPPPHVLQPHTG